MKGVGWVSYTFYIHSKFAFDRHKKQVEQSTKPIWVHGHSLGGGVSQILAVMIKRAFPEKSVTSSANGSVPVIGKWSNTLGVKFLMRVHHRDIVPILGWWSLPKPIEYIGEKKRWFGDYAIKYHMAYWW